MGMGMYARRELLQPPTNSVSKPSNADFANGRTRLDAIAHSRRQDQRCKASKVYSWLQLGRMPEQSGLKTHCMSLA